MIKSKILKDYKNINHGFFNRIGGNSTGIYKSLNCGLGSLDKKQNVQKNLDIVCKKIGCKKNHLILLHFPNDLVQFQQSTFNFNLIKIYIYVSSTKF